MNAAPRFEALSDEFDDAPTRVIHRSLLSVDSLAVDVGAPAPTQTPAPRPLEPQPRPLVAAPRPVRRRVELAAPLAAVLLAAGAALAVSFAVDHYAIARTWELLLPLIAASAAAAWLGFGLFRPASALPAVLASGFALAAVYAPMSPPPAVIVAVSSCALVLGAAFAARVGHAR